ncbi:MULTISPECIES: KH domain-containing protein [Bacillaceae]|uniref:KH domain-containing protein n=1 Tax=Bacillaceae TaxID=186817 RepID=UPI001BDF0AB7|nr:MULTISPECIES: KH domain-containing protein [Bacillaceae]MDX8362278.1 KH domain-containing protein [Cytobacillus sp. IB215316]MDX8365039.1 KH domain-containing protein [Cytobacillus sp. IB215665]
MRQLIETIVKALVDYPDDVLVKETSDERNITYHLSVHKEDMGKVIGKQGRVAKAIRTVVYAAGASEKKRIHLEIND